MRDVVRVAITYTDTNNTSDDTSDDTSATLSLGLVVLDDGTLMLPATGTIPAASLTPGHRL